MVDTFFLPGSVNKLMDKKYLVIFIKILSRTRYVDRLESVSERERGWVCLGGEETVRRSSAGLTGLFN